MEITWRDKTITCEEGTTLFDISKQVEKEYEFPIIVAKVDGVIQELYHEVIDGTTVSFCTTKDSDGKRAYIRGMSMLLLKAIQEEKAFKEEDRITIDFCLDSGYYCHLNSKEKPTKELLNRLEKRMREDVKKDIRFEKVVMRTRDARRMFEKKHMSDKSNLLKYRRNSRMTVYHLGDFTDYYYGAMPYSTGILTHFRLELFEDGFVFVVPKKEAPVTMPEFKPSIKQYHTMQMANEWSEKMQVSTVGELNEIIVNGGFQELMLTQEALHEKRIGDIGDFDVGSRHDLPAVSIDDTVLQPNAVLRFSQPGEFLNCARRFFGKRVCDLVVHVHNELSGFALMQIHVFLRRDVLRHILVHVQMIGCKIRHDRNIRRLRHAHELERRELHDGNIARVHLLRQRQKRRSDVAAEPDGVARVL